MRAVASPLLRPLLSLSLAPCWCGQAPPSPQVVRIEHFVQSGDALQAAFAHQASGGVRICCGGLASAFPGRAPSREVLQQWLTATNVVAASADDLPFWDTIDCSELPLVTTNARDRDGQPIGRPYRVASVGNVRIAVLSVIAREVPAGFSVQNPGVAIEQALATAQRESDMAVLIVDGDLAAARELLVRCPAVSLVITTRDANGTAVPEVQDDRALVHSPHGGTALGVFTCSWNGVRPGSPEHRFEAMALDAWGKEQADRLRNAMTPAGLDDDLAGVGQHAASGVAIDPAAIHDAIARGVAALRHALADDESRGVKLGYVQEHLLLALALVHCDAHRSDARFDASLRTMLRQLEVPSLGVYAAGVFTMLVEAYGQPEFHGRLRVAARYLVEGQAANGSWTYSPQVDPALCRDPDRRVLQVTGGPEPVELTPAWQRTTAWTAHGGGDNSITQFALLGLRAAQRCSVPVPAETWRRARNWFHSGQRQHGGFGYERRGSEGSGSMTLAGVCGLAITEYELGNLEFARDESVRRGLGWLRKNLSFDDNPQGSGYFYYYLYSLERTGRILDREVLGGQPWYARGVQKLLATQSADGSWPGTVGSESPRIATAFALLFLARATRQLHEERARGGTGTLRTFAHTAPGACIYVILDASGSMLEAVGSGTRFDLARAAIENVLSAVPPGPQVALRVYGHRKRAIDAGADQDTELVVPLGPFDPEAFFGKLRTLRARGKTPLARSLDEALADLGRKDGVATTVVLLTDGGEDSQPRQDPIVSARKLGGIAGLRLHVVGFDIAREDWRAQLRAMAEAGHGDFLAASDADLTASLRAAVLRAPEAFSVLAASGAEVARGRFGGRLDLPEGDYRLRTSYGGQEFSTALVIGTALETCVVFDGAQVMPLRAAEQLPCPACHRRVAPAARFCAECGARMPLR